MSPLVHDTLVRALHVSINDENDAAQNLIFTQAGAILQTGSGDTPASIASIPILDIKSLGIEYNGYTAREGPRKLGGLTRVKWDNIKLFNKELWQNGPRPLDDYVAWDWKNASFTFLAGETEWSSSYSRWLPESFSSFDKIAAGTITDMSVSNRQDSATLTLNSQMDPLRQKPISPQIYDGLGGAILTPADSGKSVDRVHHSDMVNVGDFTVMHRLKISSGASTTAETALNSDQWATKVTDNDIEVRIKGSSSNVLISSEEIGADTYATYTLVWNNSAQTADLWIDATKEADAVSVAQTIATTTQTTQWKNASGLHAVEHVFTRRWNRALADSEIEDKYKSPIDANEETSLILDFEFNTGGENIVYDQTGNQDGTVQGFTDKNDAWVATYTGDSQQAGTRIPVVGNAFNVPLEGLFSPHGIYTVGYTFSSLSFQPWVISVLKSGELLVPHDSYTDSSMTIDTTLDTLDTGGNINPAWSIGQHLETGSPGGNPAEITVKNRIIDVFDSSATDYVLFAEENLTNHSGSVTLTSPDDEALWEWSGFPSVGVDNYIIYTNWRQEVIREGGGGTYPPPPTAENLSAIVTGGSFSVYLMFWSTAFNLGFNSVDISTAETGGGAGHKSVYYKGDEKIISVVDEQAISGLSLTSKGPLWATEARESGKWNIQGWHHPDSGTVASNLTFLEKSIIATSEPWTDSSPPNKVKVGYRRNYSHGNGVLAGAAELDETIYPLLQRKEATATAGTGDLEWLFSSTLVRRTDAQALADELLEIQQGRILRQEFYPVNITTEKAFDIGKIMSTTDSRHARLTSATKSAIIRIKTKYNAKGQVIPIVDSWIPKNEEAA